MYDSTYKSSEGYLWTPTGSMEGLETKSVVTPSSNIRDSYDVIVIGAGFAGLIAARDLTQCTRAKVLLLDARDRVGGRTWTAKVANEELEMGGTWVHWNQPHVYSELYRYSLHQHLKTSAGTLAPAVQYYKPANAAIQQLDATEVNEICERVATRLFQIDGMDSRSLMPFPHDPFRAPALWKKYDHFSVRQRLDEITEIPQREKSIFETMVNSFGSAPGTKTGLVEVLRWYALGGHSMAGTFELAGIFKIGKGGMTSFALAILDEFKGDIMLGTPVARIEQNATGVTVKTKMGRQFKAKAIVCTIPLNCLSDIAFNPPLSPLRQEAIHTGHINDGAKIHFKLAATQPGWFATCSDTSSCPYVFAFSDHNGTPPSGPNGTWCIGFGYGGHLTDKTDHKHIINEFKKNIKADAEVHLYATHDWMNDPYAKGTWSCWGPGAMSKYLEELQRGDGRILFASADWADGWRGFVDGAIERGRKAARDAVKFVEISRPRL